MNLASSGDHAICRFIVKVVKVVKPVEIVESVEIVETVLALRQGD